MNKVILAAVLAATGILGATASSAATVVLQTTADGAVSNGSAPTPPVTVHTN